MAIPARQLPLQGVYNLRDIGGYPTEDGRQTRWRVLFRSDSLHRLAADGQAALIDLGLRTVIDLRYERELTEAPNVFAASELVHYLNLPLIANPTEGRREFPTLETIYQSIVDTRQAEVASIMRALAVADALPALLHCTAGKDRTGVIVGLLLRLAGVAPELIAADYSETERCLAGEFMTDLRQRTEARGVDWAAYQHLLSCPPEFMINFLAYVDERYDGVEAYCRDAGLTEDEIAALRAALVD